MNIHAHYKLILSAICVQTMKCGNFSYNYFQLLSDLTILIQGWKMRVLHEMLILYITLNSLKIFYNNLKAEHCS